MYAVTQADLARELGVSPMTVSLALRGSRRVSAPTRARVLALAASKGFRKDTVLSALGSQRWKRSDPCYLGTVAYLVPDPARALDPMMSEGELGVALKQRLGALGYGMDVISPAQFPNASALAKVIAARGIVGILHTRIGRTGWEREFPWPDFISVALNYGYFPPPQHSVVLERFPSWLDLWSRLRALGYRRPAYAGFDEPDAQDADLSAAALAFASRKVFGRNPLPPVLVHENLAALSPAFRRRVAAWIAQTRPDCLIAHNGFLLRTLLRLAPPRFATASCALCVTPGDTGISGYLEDSAAVAAAAVDILHTELRNGRLGIGGHAFRIVVPRRWVEGETLLPCGGTPPPAARVNRRATPRGAP